VVLPQAGSLCAPISAWLVPARLLPTLLPGREDAIVEKAKLRDYCLGPNHQATREADAVVIQSCEYGERYRSH
jgi:hypothetical protein